jgi:hypothetical protein
MHGLHDQATTSDAFGDRSHHVGSEVLDERPLQPAVLPKRGARAIPVCAVTKA